MWSRSRTFRLRRFEPQQLEQLPQLTSRQTQQIISEGIVDGGRLAPWGSNYTYIVNLQLGDLRHPAVYKPRDGEAPLYDFPSGTLYLREYAAYLLSNWLGWSLVPATVIRDGPYGVGSMQIFVPADGEPHIYALTREELPDLQRMVLFDLIANNADRKPAHCFRRPGGGVCAIDHGLTFNAVPKLRTVIWDFCGQQIPQWLLEELEAPRCNDSKVSTLNAQLRTLLSSREIKQFWGRYDRLLALKAFPDLDPYRNIPYGFA